MTAIQCRRGHVFLMVNDSEIHTAEWKLEQAYYKAQGCEVLKNNKLSFTKPDHTCDHCSKLEHEFHILIEEIKNE